MAIQDFNAWLETTDLSDYNDVYSLYQSVAQLQRWGGYSTIQASNGAYILSSDDVDEDLCLSTDKARDAFLEKIEKDYCNGESIESWYIFKHSMNKDD